MYKAVIKIGFFMGSFGAFTGLISCITAGSFETFFETLGRCLLLGIAAAPIISIPVADLTRCLNQLKFSRAATLGMMITVSFIPIIIFEIQKISEVFKTRGLTGRVKNPSVIFRAFFIPLIMRVINISDSLTLSLETRGFDLNNKNVTVYKPIKFTVRDAVFIFVTAASVTVTAVFI